MIRNLAAKKCTLHIPLQEKKIVREPLSEGEILDLQDMFLTNGLHEFQVKDRVTGRHLVETFLASLSCFHDTACLTSANWLMPAGVTDIYRLLCEEGYLDAYDVQNLEEFFCQKFYFDFIWIEGTQEVLTSKWFVEFQVKLTDLKIDHHVPIILLTYQDE